MIKLDTGDWGLLLLSTIPSLIYGITAATLFFRRHGSAKKFIRLPAGWSFGLMMEIPSILALPYSEIYMMGIAMVLAVFGMMALIVPRHLYVYGRQID